MKILLVEDDLEISEMLSQYLAAEGMTVVAAHDGLEACEVFGRHTLDLVLLDLMLPKKSGINVLRHIRAASVVPVIILSAKDTEADKALGLALGADDYVTKPFSVVEVLARIKANVRRTTQYAMPAAAPVCLTAGELVMHLQEYTVTKGKKKLELTAKEFEILKLLMQNPSKVYTKQQLYALVWNDAYLGDENAVNVHISRLRNKIETDSRNPRYVVTVWGIGYKLGDCDV